MGKSDRSTPGALKQSLVRHLGEPGKGEGLCDLLVRRTVEADAQAGDDAREMMRLADEWWDAMHDAGPPTRTIYEQFMNGIYVPAYNAYYSPSGKQLCIECWALFGIRDGRAVGAQFCGDECNDRRDSRERPRRSKHEKLKRWGDRVHKTIKHCSKCTPSRTCDKHSPETQKYLAAIDRAEAKADALSNYEPNNYDPTYEPHKPDPIDLATDRLAVERYAETEAPQAEQEADKKLP